MDCNQVQEMVARGECLAPAESVHAAGCVACAAVVASWGELDALLRDDMPVICSYPFDIRHGRHQAGLQALQTEGGKGGVALEAKNVGHGR